MALRNLGTERANWFSRELLQFDEYSVKRDKAYLLFLDAVGAPVPETKHQYLALTARLRTSYGTYQTPLEAKYFPSPDGLLFSVAIPKADYDDNVGMTVIAFPKEFYRGTATDPILDVRLRIEEKELKAGDVLVG